MSQKRFRESYTTHCTSIFRHVGARPSSARTFLVASFLLGMAQTVLPSEFAYAGELPQLQGKMTLTQTAREKWIAEYEFAEPIDRLVFKQVGDYRQTAWKVITPDVQFRTSDGVDTFSAPKGVTFLKMEISAYGNFVPKNYAPNIRFSDGGANVYMGFFHGSVTQNTKERELQLTTSLKGLPGETLIATPKFENSDKGDYAYAYFGPQKPVSFGDVQMIVDPAVPVWLRDLILKVNSTSAAYFEKVYQRKLSRPLSLTLALSDPNAEGFSVKGGATNGQINYRLSGKTLMTENTETQGKLAQLLQVLAAHEMAHIWQNDVKRGGIGVESPWIHEGGAEAMAADLLLKTAMWSQADFDAYLAKSKRTCESLKDKPQAYEYAYACGLDRFASYQIDFAVLWKNLILESEKTGETYSESMIQAVVERLRQAEKR